MYFVVACSVDTCSIMCQKLVGHFNQANRGALHQTSANCTNRFLTRTLFQQNVGPLGSLWTLQLRPFEFGKDENLAHCAKLWEKEFSNWTFWAALMWSMLSGFLILLFGPWACFSNFTNPLYESMNRRNSYIANHWEINSELPLLSIHIITITIPKERCSLDQPQPFKK